MKCWDSIKKMHLNPPDKYYFKRLPHVESNYQEYILSSKNKYTSLNDMIFSKIFTDGYTENDLNWKLTRNKFPYHLEENVDHLLLWIHPKNYYNLNEIENIISFELENSKYEDWIYFKNRKKLRSVDGIEHYHIMARKKIFQ